MKGTSRTAIILTALAMLLMPVAGFSKSTRTPTKSTAKHRTSVKHKKIKTTRKSPAKSASDHVYIVRPGDSLIQIARANQTDVDTLKAANGLKSSRIKAGQELTIPGLQVESATQKAAPKPAAPAQDSAVQHMSQLREQNLIPETESPSMRLRLVEAGFKMIGIRYRVSGGSEKTGFDCSGLVKNLFSKFNIDLPRSSREQYQQGEKIDRDKLEVGDLVFFSSGGSRPTHVGIYIGNDKFLHAARKARQVMVSDLNKIWYTMRYIGARRVADLWGDESEPSSDNQ